MIKHPMTLAAVRARLEAHQQAGHHVDSRLMKEIEQPGVMSVATLADQAQFLRLIWQANDHTRVLTPHAAPRSLRDCAERIRTIGGSFQALVDAGHAWFETCVEIDSQFDYSALGWVVVTPATDGERRSTPGGTHYVYDGVHKSIVLAKKLLWGELEYEPVEVLLLEPRRR